jgi:hypothetical protein
MSLYFDTPQPNYTKRLPTIREKELLYFVCACPIAFEVGRYAMIHLHEIAPGERGSVRVESSEM